MPVGFRRDYTQGVLGWPWLLFSFLDHFGNAGFDRKLYEEGGTFSRDARTFRPETSAVHFDQAPADGSTGGGFGIKTG